LLALAHLSIVNGKDIFGMPDKEIPGYTSPRQQLSGKNIPDAPMSG
jgi:hypothetical protein